MKLVGVALVALLAVVAGTVALSDGEAETDIDNPASEPNARPSTTIRESDQPVEVPTTIPSWLVEIEERVALELSRDTTEDARPESFDEVVQPGDSIQSAVDRLPEGATLLIGSGVHVGQQVTPKSGMTFVGEPGAVLDGGGSTRYAFVAFAEDDADDVTIRGLEIRNYQPDFPAHGAIYGAPRNGWLVEQCEVHNTAYAGVYVGSNSTVRDCYLHHNGKIGLKANGENVLILNNEIAFNNPDDAFDQGFEAGGFKFIESDGLIVHENYIHDNLGPGIWADVDAIRTLIEDNVIENNSRVGINYEISSHGVIRNNTVRNNGHGHPGGWMWGAGIQIRGPHVQVYGNLVHGNQNGIALIQTDRGSEHDLSHVFVRDNLIIESGLNGGVRNAGPATIFDTSRFENNEYRYGDLEAEWWEWDDSSLKWEEWTSTGNDVNGVLRDS